MEEKTPGQQLREALLNERKNGWDVVDEATQRSISDYCEGYKTFLDKGKTERDCVDYTVELAQAAGFVPFERGMELQPGAKVYRVNRGRGVNLAVVGSAPLDQGVSITASHIDSPRLDLKPSPLYEEGEMAYLKTHYYGGIKKYQWTAIPLSMHGKIVRKDGSEITVNVGENEGDPQFCITDILPHLGKDQSVKKLGEAFTGEDLNVLVGSLPLDAEGEQLYKLNVMKLLHEQYGIVESDLISAELELVPAFNAADIGFDRSMIGAYGHDDRVCAYPSFEAMLRVSDPEKTCVCLLVDKEEIGSVGATGMHSRFFEDAVAEILNLMGRDSDLAVRRAMRSSKVLSSDVSAAYDPNYPEVMEKRNAAYFGKGLVFNKYTGSRGKSGSNDANAEYMARIRHILDERNIAYQTAELGKVDQGGGGTIAYILANYGMQVIDSGVAVLNMHAPWEIISKVDLYEALLGYVAFLEDM